MLYTIQITHPDGEIRNDKVFLEDKTLIFIEQASMKYPKSKVEIKQVRGIASCWHCGEPVILTSVESADNVCQLVDRLCCSESCESKKDVFPGVNRK